MKYTKYLLKGDYVNIEQFENKEHPFYNFPLVVVSIPLVVMLFGGIIIMLPVTFTFDNGRWVWYKWLLYDRKHHVTDNVQEIVTNITLYRIIDHVINKLTQGIHEQIEILSGSVATFDGRAIENKVKRLYDRGADGFRRSQMPGVWKERVVYFAKRISLSA